MIIASRPGAWRDVRVVIGQSYFREGDNVHGGITRTSYSINGFSDLFSPINVRVPQKDIFYFGSG